MRATAAAALGLCLTGGAQAGEAQVSGFVTYSIKPLASTPAAGGSKLGKVHLKGVMVSNDPAHSLHLATQDCLGSSLDNADGSPIDSYGTCVATDKDGDVWWLVYHNGVGERTWTVLGGTGKYEGVSGGGTSEWLLGTGDGRAVVGYAGKMFTK